MRMLVSLLLLPAGAPHWESMCADDVHSKSASGCLHSNHRLFFSIFSFPSMKLLPKYENAALAINHADVDFPVITVCRGTSLGVTLYPSYMATGIMPGCANW
jgi:hypothetical protein